MRKKILNFVLTLCLIIPCVLALSACKKDEEHTHTYSSKWSSDENYHWHQASCEHEDERIDLGEHEWNEGTVTVEATIAREGEKTYTCNICARQKTEVIPQLISIEGAEIGFEGNINCLLNSSSQMRPSISVTLGQTTLTKGIDYTVVYDYTEESYVKVNVTGINSYGGSCSKSILILDSTMSNIDLLEGAPVAGVIENISLESVEVPQDVVFETYLYDGVVMTFSPTEANAITVDGELKVSGNGKMVVADKSAFSVSSTGKLTVDGLEIESGKDAIRVIGGELNFVNGKINSARYAFNVQEGAKVTIQDGKISSIDTNIVFFDEGTTVTILNGTFNAVGKDAANFAGCNPYHDTIVNIYGGTFNSHDTIVYMPARCNMTIEGKEETPVVFNLTKFVDGVVEEEVIAGFVVKAGSLTIGNYVTINANDVVRNGDAEIQTGNSGDIRGLIVVGKTAKATDYVGDITITIKQGAVLNCALGDCLVWDQTNQVNGYNCSFTIDAGATINALNDYVIKSGASFQTVNSFENWTQAE